MRRTRFSALVERIRSSLFVVPLFAVLSAVAVGFALLAIDRRLDPDIASLPLGFTSTVESARTLLGTIAGATISFAGVVFSVSLLILQLGSSQYSPRVIHTLFRDPFNRRVMALVVGTFTYCIVVLRSVRSSLDPGGDPVIPNVAVALAVVLGIATILAIVAFIDHNAHTMDVSEILERIRRDTTDQIGRTWKDHDASGPRLDADVLLPDEGGVVIRATRSGWVQQIDTGALLACLPPGATATVLIDAGDFAIVGRPLLIVSSPTFDEDREGAARAAVVLGPIRTMQQDVTYGLRQTVDIALKALSPGINDPTTAQDAIFHAAAILVELLRRDPPPSRIADGGRTVLLAKQARHDDLVRLAVEEVRRAAASHPAVCIYLLEAIGMVIDSLKAEGLSSRTVELERQARLVAEGCGSAAVPVGDIAAVRAAHGRLIGGHAEGTPATA